jgi:hypothetical protein
MILADAGAKGVVGLKKRNKLSKAEISRHHLAEAMGVFPLALPPSSLK